MKLSVVFAVLCCVIVDLEAAILRPRSRSLEPKTQEIALRLLPPALPHDHHHHNHNNNNQPPASNSGPNNAYIPPRPTATTKRPTSSRPSSDIVKYEYENLPDGGYRFLYETSDGQKRNENGYFRDDEKLGKILTVHGSYEYIDTNGELVVVRYVADENGYRTEEEPSIGLPPNVVNTLVG